MVFLDQKVIVSTILFFCNPVVGTARLLPSYSIVVEESIQKGWSEGSEKPFLCILLRKDKAQKARGE